jgi:hypothetical protein
MAERREGRMDGEKIEKSSQKTSKAGANGVPI